MMSLINANPLLVATMKKWKNSDVEAEGWFSALAVDLRHSDCVHQSGLLALSAIGR